MAKKKCRVGDVALIPLPGGGFVCCVIGRSSPKNIILFIYVFGPRLQTRTNISFEGLDPDQALARYRCGGWGVKDGTWIVVGSIPSWNKEPWAMPPIKRVCSITGRVYADEYSDEDPSQFIKSTLVDDSFVGLPNGCAGHILVAELIEDILSQVETPDAEAGSSNS